jgi:hypothetical protein
MKTVLQELIEQLEKNAEATKNSAIEIGILRSCKMATELLEKEKEQIKEAYKFSLESPSIELSEEWAEEYYNKTFKQ